MKPLIVFEMANNHNGLLSHGLRIIKTFQTVAAPFREKFDFAFKLQYRDLDTYIHPSHKGEGGYIKRFEETRISRQSFAILLKEIRACNFKAICTPFDEVSVTHVVEDGFDYLKIASASLCDWPLMHAIAKSGLPVIASTGGASVEQIWKSAAFFRHRNIPLTLLHCVAEYPATESTLQIRQIEELRKLHPDLNIGFSTHELPTNKDSIGLALALGASVIEKHVGIGTKEKPLNQYSVSPKQATNWLKSGDRALKMLGGERKTSEFEQDSLAKLRRGVYAKDLIPAGKILTTNDVTFAFPASKDQLTANEWSKYTMHETICPLTAGAPVLRSSLTTHDMRDSLHSIARAVHEMVAKSGVVIPHNSALEISHHYGLDEFGNTGLAMFTLINREYCKKILLMLPGQSHPEQYHNRKEETFVVLHGDMELILDGFSQQVSRGDVVTIKPGVRHAFSTEHGVVFEEISTTHEKEDSFYTDPAINGNAYRKTFIDHWYNA